MDDERDDGYDGHSADDLSSDGNPRPSRSSERHAQRAAEHFRRGRLAEAETELRKALAAEPARGDWHFNLGLTLEAAGRSEDALAAFRDAVTRLPRRAEARLAEGSMLCRLGRFAEALAPLTTATMLDRRCEPAWARRIEAAAAIGAWEDSETAYYLAQHALERMPLCLVAMGDTQLARGRHERAAWCFREALTQSPEMPRVRAKLALALATGGSKDAAVRMYLEELRSHPGDVQTLIETGDLLATLHRVGEAVEKYRRAAELAPTHPTPRARLGMLLGAIGRHEQARAELETAYALDPDAHLVRVTLATSLLAGGAATDALRFLREDVERRKVFHSDTAAVELLRAAGTLAACGAPDEAADLLERVARGRPADLDVLRRLMVMSFAAGRRRRARGYARRLARLARAQLAIDLISISANGEAANTRIAEKTSHAPETGSRSEDSGASDGPSPLTAREVIQSTLAACDYNLALDAIESGRLRVARQRIQNAIAAHPQDWAMRRLRSRWWLEAVRLTVVRALRRTT